MKSKKYPYIPEKVSAPGSTLLDILQRCGLTQAELARKMKRPLKTINEIIKGKTQITPSTAIQLAAIVGPSASFWINREANYRLYLEAKKIVNEFEREK